MRAIDIFLNHQTINGNTALAAKLLGVKQQTLWRWANKKTKVDMPLELFKKAAEIIGVHPQELRPDIFKKNEPSEFIAQVFE